MGQDSQLSPKNGAKNKNVPTKKIAFAPEAGFETKSLPIAYFTKLIKDLDSKLDKGVEFLLIGCSVGSPYETELKCLERSVQIKSTSDSILESCSAIEESAVLVCADSAPLHLAEFLGTPCAALFGPTVQDFGFSPRLQESAIFESNLGCRPCSLHGKTACRYTDNSCFFSIDIEDIIHFVLKKLEMS